MIKLPMEWIVGGSTIVALVIALVITGQGCQTAKAKLEASQLREANWKAEQERCEENKEKLHDALADVDEKITEISDLTIRLQGSEATAHRIALELAEANTERASIASEYADLRARAVDMNTCQTYELVWAALAGEGP